MSAYKPCKDCEPGGARPAPHPGPRCVTHHRLVVKARRARASELRTMDTYGLTAERFEAMLEAQGGRCLICLKPFRKRPSVDHDHACCPGKVSCGKCVRGLLHNQCNKLLGFWLRDDPNMADRAAKYLRERSIKTRDSARPRFDVDDFSGLVKGYEDAAEARRTGTTMQEITGTTGLVRHDLFTGEQLPTGPEIARWSMLPVHLPEPE